MNHVFLDLETLARTPNAVIFEIGVVAFDPRSGAIGTPLDLRLNADNQVMRGRRVDEETVAWHAEQGSTIRMSEGLDLALALSALHDWFSKMAPESVWIWGSDFDRPILEDACLSCDLELPWPYYKIMDGRTIWRTAFPFEKHPPRPHHAVEDCLASIRDLRTALTKLGLLEVEVVHG